jgi:hypothetical protein
LLLNINLYMKTTMFYRAISRVSKGFNIFIPIFTFTIRDIFFLSEVLKSDSFSARLTHLQTSTDQKLWCYECFR